MALQKQTIQFTFKGGLDTIEDPFQLPIGKFVSLNNTQFIKRSSGGISSLEKRNGFGQLTQVTGTTSFITTFKNNLLSISGTIVQSNLGFGQVPASPTILAYSSSLNSWIRTFGLIPLQVNTSSLVKNTFSQSGQDMAVSGDLVCVTYADTSPAFRYAIFDVNTGQNIVSQTSITSSGGVEVFPARVYSFNNKFVIAHDVWNQGITTSSVFHLQLLTIPAGSPSSLGSVTTVSSNYGATSTTMGGSLGAFDGVVSSGSLFMSWATANAQGAHAVKIADDMTRGAIKQISSQSAAGGAFAVCADSTVGSNSTIYTTFCAGSSQGAYAVATDSSLNSKFPTQTINTMSTLTVGNLSCYAQAGQMIGFLENNNAYSFTPAIPSKFISSFTVSSAGAASADINFIRSVGIASKPVIINSTGYFLVSYQSTYQPTYYLVGIPSLGVAQIHAQLAYTNGGGYLNPPPSAVVIGSSFCVPYLFKNSITSVSKDTGTGSTTQTAGVYSNLGVNLAKFTFTDKNLCTKEIGNALNINGGFLWSYDGLRATENNFFVYPDDVYVSTNGNPAGSQMAIQTYFYQTIYEYTDNQGNIYRSAPSIPKSVVTGSGNASVAIFVPTLRLTYKTAPNLPSIGIYRWSENQQNYYKIGPATVQSSSFLLNVDSISVVDKASDAAILGNELLYTTGGVIENTGAPSPNTMATFDNRLWLVDAEDPNLLWYSKPILETTPVEMSDLQTYFVSPTAGTQSPTGPIVTIAPMDDKLIVFKRNTIYYIAGNGPDATGANSQYSEPIFINGTVGCLNKNSVVLTPNGLMFQSDNGIWLLGRDLSLNYIGKDVEVYNNSNVVSSVYIPGTSEVRFSLDTGEVLVYDYLATEWGVDTGVAALSSTIYKNLHTYVNSSNTIFQETVGSYVDGSTPTTVSFTTGWLNLAGLQGYVRLYKMYLLGQFQSAHQLNVGIAYDYDPAVKQTVVINPTNTVGSGSQVEQWQINPMIQQCQAVQLTLQEVSSASAGAGVSISGINVVVGVKKSYPGNIAVQNRKG